MEAAPPPFTFPPGMPPDVAAAMLAEAYHALDAGKLLRRALKEQRRDGWDPPMDVQYVAEPRIEAYEEGLGVSLNTDILLYEEFEGMDECLDLFEAILGEALIGRLEKAVRRWARDHPAEGPGA